MTDKSNLFTYDATWKHGLKDKIQAIEEINYILHEAGFPFNFKILVGGGTEAIINLNPIMPENPYIIFSRNGGYIKPKKGDRLKSKESFTYWLEKLSQQQLIELATLIYSNPQIEARLPPGVLPHFFDLNWLKWYKRNIHIKEDIEPEPEVIQDIIKAVYGGSEFSEIKDTHHTRRINTTVRQKVWFRDGGKCVKCSSRKNLQFDHIIPYSLGGSSAEENIELLCSKCNAEKKNIIM